MSIGFTGFLTIVLVILKALGYLTISWFLCFLPIIIGVVGTLFFIGLLLFLE
jgi:hypothetical protein